jgi:serine/threonine protein phosphatase 1
MGDESREHSMNRTIAIGDIHGCAKALEAIIEAIVPGPEDVLVALGDYVDRGPDSRSVLDLMLQLETRCDLVPLLGNHELMMLSVLAGDMDLRSWLQFGGSETLHSYRGDILAADPAHVEFLHRCRRHHENDTHLFMHANYIADLDLAEQPDSTLFWTHVSSVIPPPHRSGKTAVVGHTPQFSGEILDLGHLICVDTCCVGGGFLTALEVTTGQVWQADLAGTLRKSSTTNGTNRHE